MEAFLSSLRELTFGTMCLRIMLAMLLGGFLGFDREIWGRPAGFRTYMLVAMAAAATSILSQYLNLMLDTCWKEAYSAVGNRTDVVRFGAQVVSGIGFLGTGTILITQRKEVTGLTTACCLWAAGCMGLAIGAGFYECVLVGFLIIFIALRVLSPIRMDQDPGRDGVRRGDGKGGEGRRRSRDGRVQHPAAPSEETYRGAGGSCDAARRRGDRGGVRNAACL